MHSGGAQLFAQRAQPAQSVFFWSRAWLYVRQSTLLPPSAQRTRRRAPPRGETRPEVFVGPQRPAARGARSAARRAACARGGPSVHPAK